MTDGIIIAAIGVVGAVIVAFTNYKIAKLSKRVNGRMDELLEITRKSSKAEGKKEQRDDDNNKNYET